MTFIIFNKFVIKILFYCTRYCIP